MSNSVKLARANLTIDPVHDGRHRLADKPMARESIPYLINLPAEGVAFFTYTWVDCASNAGAMIAIYGPAVGATPIQERLADRPVPEAMNFDQWSIDGFRLEQDLQFTKAAVRWESTQAAAEFDFAALHPPYAYGSNKNGCPPYAADNRIEQSGRVKGVIKLGGREIKFDTTGHRDHSWGTRDWRAFQHYEWFEGQTRDGVCVHFWRIQALGRIELLGYVVKDGLMAEIASVEPVVTTDRALLQRRLDATVVDEAGRTTTIGCDFTATYPLVPDPEIVLNEGSGAALIDGKRGVGHLESAWPKAYLEHIARVGGY